MPGHVDILEEHESVRKPLLGSLGLHTAAFALLLASHFVTGGSRQSWGDLNSGGPGSISVNVVSRVPLPSRAGTVNPLANNSEFTVPEPPPKPKAERKAPAPEPDAIPLKSRNAPRRPAPESASTNRFHPPQERTNQLYSNTGPALVSPMIGQTGSGGVGIGTGSPFGNRFGNYVTILRQRVAEKWHTGDVDPRIKTAPPVIVTFTLMRDGSVRDVRIGQRSGNAALDYSAQRAIYDASPFPPIPAAYERNDATIEFWFELRR